MFHRIIALGPLLALFFMPSAGFAAPAPPCFDVDVQYMGREFAFSKDGLSHYEWHYRVTGRTCINRGLSHWVLDLCPDLYSKLSAVSLQSVDNSAAGGTVASYRYGTGNDPTTGISGLKWDFISGNAINVAGEYDDFSFISPGDVGSVRWSSRGSTILDYGTTMGPTCGVAFTPVPTDRMSWSRIKVRFSS